MYTLIKPVLVTPKKDTLKQVQTETRSEDMVLEMAAHYHLEANKHHQEGDHEKAARDIMQALSYYRQVE